MTYHDEKSSYVNTCSTFYNYFTVVNAVSVFGPSRGDFSDHIKIQTLKTSIGFKYMLYREQ